MKGVDCAFFHIFSELFKGPAKFLGPKMKIRISKKSACVILFNSRVHAAYMFPDIFRYFKKALDMSENIHCVCLSTTVCVLVPEPRYNVK